MKRKRISITGGWGYGNIGDTAILVSACQNIKEICNEAEIRVLTYEDEHDLSAIHPDIRQIKSAHRLIDLNTSHAMYGRIEWEASEGYLGRKTRSLLAKLINKMPVARISAQLANYENLRSEIKSSDALIVAGGGYFNQDWNSKVLAILKEVSIAREHHKPFAIMGVTVGAISDSRLAREVSELFGTARFIAVRDLASQTELRRLSVESKLIPDWALSTISSPVRTENKLGVSLIVNELSSAFLRDLAESLRLNAIASVKLVLSRLWAHDLSSSLKAQSILLRNGISASIVVPGGLADLERELSSSELVISQNLHGLIVAFRAATEIVAVNRYKMDSPNYRKFVGFMEQAGRSAQTISIPMGISEIAAVIGRAMHRKAKVSEESASFCNSVAETIKIELNRLI